VVMASMTSAMVARSSSVSWGSSERLGVFRASSHLFPQVSARPNRLRVRYARLVRVLPQKTPAGWRVAWMSFIVRSIRLPRTVALRP